MLIYIGSLVFSMIYNKITNKIIYTLYVSNKRKLIKWYDTKDNYVIDLLDWIII